MTVTIRVGDCRNLLEAMPDESVNCVVTSPPYWGLRDYGVVGQIGSEQNFDDHLATLVGVFSEIRRVLRSDGTVWVNYGSAYASPANGRSAADTKATGSDDRTFRDKPFSTADSAAAYGISGKALRDFRENGYPSVSLCGGCRASWPHPRKTHSDHQHESEQGVSPCLPIPENKELQRGHQSTSGCWRPSSSLRAPRGTSGSHTKAPAQETLPSAPLASNIEQSSALFLDESTQAQTLAASSCLSVLETSSLGVSAFAHMSGAPSKQSFGTQRNAEPFGVRHIRSQRIAGYCSSCGSWSDDIRSNVIDPLCTGAVFKAKDEMLMPARLAIALQSAGWWVRSEIIWSKPNPMPESVTDRPACQHEKIFMLTKSQKYWYDAQAVRRPMADVSVSRLEQNIESQEGSARANGGKKTNGKMKAVGKVDKQRGHSRRDGGFNDRWDAMSHDEQTASAHLRNVWTIPTAAFSEAHFATFPPALVEPCVKAGCPTDGIVLDPFGGAGTVGLVADRLGRDALMFELNPAYAEIARKRLLNDGGMFIDVQMTPHLVK